jgi:lysophospholipase L1-like esterase
MRIRFRRFLVNLSLVFLSLTASLAVAELMARVFVEERQSNHQRMFVEYDPELGWRKIPNKVGTFTSREYQTTEKINSKGIRGPEYAYAKRPDEFRILVLGDSFAEGYTVEFNDLFSEILKRRLNEGRDRFFEVINTGTAGYSTDQELILFQRDGRKYRPDLTILLFYYNDVYYNARRSYWRGNKPVFALRDGQLVLTNTPVPHPGAAVRRPGTLSRYADQDRQSASRASLAAMKNWLFRYSKLYRFVSVAVKENHVLYGLANRLGFIEGGRRDGRVYIPGVFRVWETTPDGATLHAWKLTEALIGKLKAETRAIGSDLLVFYVPHRIRIYEDNWRATKRKYGLTDESWDLARVSKNLKDICMRTGIDYIDPTEVFRTESKLLGAQGKRLYLTNDTHWTAEGHALVGRLLAQFARERYLRPM